ncbi:MAG: helix-turn-helix transcriptional regulator [Cellvibrionaceae bacterium]|nr:helix-turn-helix transcriptional regulator [Cellvibrionaceae bacterium]
MTAFLRTILTRILLTAALSGLILYIGADLAEKEVPLMPQSESGIAWVGSTQPPATDNQTSPPPGVTYTKVLEEGETIRYEIFLSSQKQYPYGSYDFTFLSEAYERHLVDLTSIESFRFSVTCTPKNVLIFVIFTFDDKVSDFAKDHTHRVNWHFFTCDGSWSDQEVKLQEFETPDWWLQLMELELADKKYDVRKTLGFSVVNSLQSPRDTLSQIAITGLVGIERRPIFIYVSLAIAGAMWAVMLWWGFMLYAQQLVAKAKERMKEDMPLTAYQKLSISPQVDKTKRNLLLFLAKEYADPEIGLDMTTERLGINKSKINTILKDELGMTFTAYINKLRLTEAARLLSEYPDETISQIAYRVGFNNPSYFNKLFKETYGCSPKHFKVGASGKPSTDAES